MGEDGVRANAALAAAVVFWGLSFVATKVALESFPTFTLIFCRFALGSCLFLALVVPYGFPRLKRRDHAKLFLTALFEPGLYFVFETLGLQHTSAASTALIIGTIPVVVLVLAVMLLGERVGLGHLLGLGASLLGVATLVIGDSGFTWILAGHLLGDLFIFGAVGSAALYMVCARDLGRSYSARDITTMQTFYGALFYAPAFLWELPTTQWAAISGRSLAALAYLALFATIVAFFSYNYALTKVPASRASVFINGIPVVTALAAWVFLGEKLTALQAGGGLLVLFGVYLANLPNTRAVPRSLRQSAS
jgi:drug/metabolite transporter (DMT)-like permease